MAIQTQPLSFSVFGAAAFGVFGYTVARLFAPVPASPALAVAPPPDPRLAELGQRLEESQAACATLRAELARHAGTETLVAERDQTILMLRQEGDELRARVAASQQRAMETEALRAQAEHARSKLDELRRELEGARARVLETKTELEKKSASELSAARSEAQKARAEAQKLAEEVKRIAADREQLVNQLARRDLAKAREAELEGEVRRSSAELEKLRGELTERESEQLLSTELETRLEHARHALDAEKARARELEAAAKRAATTAADLETRLNDQSARARKADELEVRVEHLVSELETRVEQLVNELERKQSELESLGTRLVAADAQSTALRAELQRARSVNEALAADAVVQREAAAGQADLDKELTDARAEARGYAMRLQAAEAKAKEVDQLRNEIDGLRGQLRDNEVSLVPRQELDALKKKHRDLMVRAQLMDQRIQELKQSADENAVLREDLVRREASAARAEELALRVADLEAQLFAAQLKRPSEAAPKESLEGLAPEVLPTVAATIERMLGDFMVRGRYQVAVLADTNGFMIGASGDTAHHENLAAVSGLVDELSQRSRGLLPLGPLRLIEIADENGVSLRTRFFEVEDQTLALTTLGSAGGPADNHAAAAISSVTTALATHASASH